ncbi:dihydroorotate dehydrogenase [Thermoanaerobacterium thermosaccharolyticum]|uniref:Dihydroorotate dehydrogenase n=2 Tax=Thermoanaerobacterium thermosaccharolyticum TaxID=1517 RepID=D9TNT1_THETC|nr:dihydroorotate dehydrogenase [Thermoanaerobacterium thermosaccharolyticum]ADL69050.1 dihydroorotate dehydrogenase family protein [Thermoanaerobacterium thermosaccharolyticum DSM 571]AST58905.1 dihydroorotate dehydrogenase family protein [Thermoanaerobacterium thermosaccharolyticum]OXT06387.1 dihydroorotate dehydrogenase [Thermoanaerobacterium thermosaccharolyticum]TCW35367.1 dihydroorotate dehydrogenase (NAD+) catalytic subunit [Thermohydrogenium kirishiense]
MSLKVNIGNLEFKNPVFVASGTFGFGKEYSQYVDLNKLGAIMVKGLTLNPKEGNPPPRIYETPSGILNSVGLQNPGVDGFLRDELPFLKKFDTKVIVNIAGETIEEFVTMAQKLDIDGVHALELNVSCPNVKEGGMAFGVNPNSIYEITKRVKGVTNKIVIVKLTPNVADIKIYAKAAEDGGADAVSLINTITGMAVDINSRKPIFKNIFAGLSGPAVKPIALKYVYEAKKAVSIPVIGMGGISSAEDAIEFMIVGATAVAIGTYNFINPTCTMDILEDIKKYMNKNNVSDINQIINSINV